MEMKTCDQPYSSIGLIGLGLIGGSLARSIRRAHPETRITAWNRRRAVAEAALSDGVIDQIADEDLSSFSECELIVLCTPVVTALSFMERLAAIRREGAIISDAGSVKSEIHSYAASHGLTDCFVGGHPMAGSEKTGYEASSDRLLENAWYILTPEKDVPSPAVDRLASYIASIGALPLVMTPEEHDDAVAAISHLPHVISASLVNLVHDLDGDRELLRTIAAGGFRDITRISSSSPQMWQEICLANRSPIVEVLDQYIASLSAFRDRIAVGDAKGILDRFTACKDYRDSFAARPAAGADHRIYLEIADEPGAIAEISLLLANRRISIRNIGIVHNREFEQGVLRIEFYTADDCRRGAEALRARNYTVYEEG